MVGGGEVEGTGKGKQLSVSLSLASFLYGPSVCGFLGLVVLPQVSDVEDLVLKYAGDYPNLVKKLEAKYHDYGFFIGWDREGDFQSMQKETYQWVSSQANKYYQRYVPWQVMVPPRFFWREGGRGCICLLVCALDNPVWLIPFVPSLLSLRRKQKVESTTFPRVPCL